MALIRIAGVIAEVERRVKVRAANDNAYWVKRSEAIDMVLRGQAWIIAIDPLVIREARSFEFSDERRRRRGRLLLGAEHPDPDRRPLVLSEKDGKRHRDQAPAVFSHYDEEDEHLPLQGICFPPDLIPEEVDFRRYRRRFLRGCSEEEYRKQLEREALISKHNDRCNPERSHEERQKEHAMLRQLVALHSRDIRQAPLPDSRTMERKLNRLARRRA